MTNATYHGCITTTGTHDVRVRADDRTADDMVVIYGNGWAAMVNESEITRDA